MRASRPAEAIAIGAIDSVSGFVIQAMLLVVIAIGNLVSSDLSTEDIPVDVNGKRLILAVALVVALVVAAVFVPRLRRMIAPHLTGARAAAQALREPTKLLQQFGGNVTAQLPPSTSAGDVPPSVRSTGHAWQSCW